MYRVPRSDTRATVSMPGLPSLTPGSQIFSESRALGVERVAMGVKRWILGVEIWIFGVERSTM